jgi:hypothetical protein
MKSAKSYVLIVRDNKVMIRIPGDNKVGEIGKLKTRMFGVMNDVFH